MTKMTRTNALLAIGLILVGATGLLADGGNKSQTRIRTRLSGAAISGRTPDGSAEFRADTARNRSQLNVEVEHVNLPADTMLDVSLTHGATTLALGKIRINALGEGELELNSQDGATVPAVQKGDIITLSNAGTNILAGSF